MRRWLLAGAMLVFPLTGALAVAGTASAAQAAGTIKCTSLAGTVNTSTLSAKGTLSGCNDTANTGGKGTFKGSETATTGSIKWNKTGTTTFDNVMYSATSPDTCPNSEDEETVTGDVEGGTGAALKSIKVGYTFTAYLCVVVNSTTGAVTLTLAPGTDWNIGKKF
jgi:hypothetical protein